MLPPKVKKELHITKIHGVELKDYYYWLRERENPRVKEHLELENQYTDWVMEDTAQLQKELFEEMKRRIKEEDKSVETPQGDYFYYNRTLQGKEYKVWYRRHRNKNEEEKILDLNEIAESEKLTYLKLGAFKVSPDGNFLAYSLDINGSEEFTLYCKNLLTNEVTKMVENIYYNVEWDNSGEKIFYHILTSDTKRPYRLYVYDLKSKTSELLLEEKDEAFFLHFGKSKDKKYIFINCGSTITTECWFIDLSKDKYTPVLFAPRCSGVEYYVTSWRDLFFIHTNENAINFKVLTVDQSNFSDKKSWQEFLPHNEEVWIEDLETFSDFIVIKEREQGIQKFRVFSASGSDYYIDFPEEIYTIDSYNYPVWEGNNFRFYYTSLKTPNSVYDFDLLTKERKLIKKQEIVGGYDEDNYVTERLLAVSSDGTQVPISLVYKKGLLKNSENPLFLNGYGAYGICKDPYFSSVRLSLLERGFVFAIAHIRGGGDLGRAWYENGKFLKKKNTFYDFIASAKKLIEEGYTSPEKLIINGGSAGGLLMGAVTNMAPELFKGVIAEVPFVDTLNTMLDASLPLTVTEYEEWGNPNEKEYFDYIRSYSPYDNVEAKEYPNILATGGWNDPRVSYWEPAKWVAKLRELKKDSNIVILKTHFDEGHMGASGRYSSLKEMAFIYAFCFKILQN
jgi:oligopeptidase B